MWGKTGPSTSLDAAMRTTGAGHRNTSAGDAAWWNEGSLRDLSDHCCLTLLTAVERTTTGMLPESLCTLGTRVDHVHTYIRRGFRPWNLTASPRLFVIHEQTHKKLSVRFPSIQTLDSKCRHGQTGWAGWVRSSDEVALDCFSAIG